MFICSILTCSKKTHPKESLDAAILRPKDKIIIIILMGAEWTPTPDTGGRARHSSHTSLFRPPRWFKVVCGVEFLLSDTTKSDQWVPAPPGIGPQ